MAQSGLVGRNGPDSQAQGRPPVSSPDQLQLADGQTRSSFETWTDSKGVVFTKEFVLSVADYDRGRRLQDRQQVKPSRSRYSSTVS